MKPKGSQNEQVPNDWACPRSLLKLTTPLFLQPHLIVEPRLNFIDKLVDCFMTRLLRDIFSQIYQECGLNASTGVQHKWKPELSRSPFRYIEAPFLFKCSFLFCQVVVILLESLALTLIVL